MSLMPSGQRVAPLTLRLCLASSTTRALASSGREVALDARASDTSAVRSRRTGPLHAARITPSSVKSASSRAVGVACLTLHRFAGFVP